MKFISALWNRLVSLFSYKQRTIQFSILMLCISLLVFTAVTILSYSYYQNSRAVLNLSENLINQVNQTIIEKTKSYLNPAALMGEVSSKLSQEKALSITNTSQLEAYTRGFIQPFSQLDAFYFADTKGNFLMAKRQANQSIGTKYVLKSNGRLVERWKYRDKSGKIVKSTPYVRSTYDARKRPWYKGAMATDQPFWTNVYVFFTSKKPGITASYSVRNTSGQFLGVFGIDIQLDQISNFLAKQKIGKSGIVFILNNDGEIVAFPDITKTVKQDGDKVRPLHINELNMPWISTSYKHYLENFKSRFHFKSKRVKYIASYTPFPPSFGKKWNIVLIVPESDFLGEIQKTNRESLMISAIILLMGIIFAIIFSRSISIPIVALAEETKKIKDFHLDNILDIKAPIWEIQLMNESISSMKNGLAAFKKYVPSELVRQLMKSGIEAELGGQKQRLSLLFTDIIGFTSISESMEAEELTIYLSHYLNEMTTIIRDKNGTIDKFIGDAIMIFWNAPMENPNHAYDACIAALVCKNRITELNKKWQKEGKPPLTTRFGINTGECLVGNVGSSYRMNYTALGDTVNLASRLESINTTYGSLITVSEFTYDEVNPETNEAVKDLFVFRPLDKVAVKGKKQPILIYELLCEVDDPQADEFQNLNMMFSTGFYAYLQRRWDKAFKSFNEILAQYPEDGPSKLYIQRCQMLQSNPPDPDWDGVWRMYTK